MGKTSWEVKHRYNSKVYKSIKVDLKKDLVERFDMKLKNDGLSKAEFIRRAISAYLDDESPSE